MDAVTDQGDIRKIIAERPEQLEGFTVVASDGQAGRVAANQDQVDDDHLVVHVGNRMLGHDVVIESEVVSRIDHKAREVHLSRITDWVKSSPRLKHYAKQ